MERRVAVMGVNVSVCGHKRVAVSFSDAISVCGAVSVVMRSILDVGDASISCVLLLVPVACEHVAVSLSDAVSVCGALGL